MLMRFISKIKSFLFENRGTRQTIIKNTLWLSTGQMGSRLVRAIIVIYAARVIGATEYGVFSYALGLAGFFTTIADIGIGQILIRESAKNPEQRSYYFSTTFWIKLTLLVCAALAMIFVVPYSSKVKYIDALLPFMALLIIFDGLRDFALSLFRAMEKMEWETIITVATNLFITLLGLITLYYFKNAKYFAAAYVLGAGAGMAIAVFIVRREFYKIFSYVKTNLIRPILRSAVPIAFSSAIGAFMLNTDLVMLGWWQSAEQIGYYAAGQKIIQVLFTLPAILANAILPTLSRLIGEGSHDKIRILMEKSFANIFMVSAPIIVGIIVLAKPIIRLLYGAEYTPGSLNFAVMALALIFTFPSALLSLTAIAYDRQKQVTKYLFLSSIANAVFDAILIPIFGIVGSTIATIIALIIEVGLSWRLMKKIINFQVLVHLPKIVLAAILMGGLSFALETIGVNLIANILLSAIFYFGLLYITREKSLYEFKFVIDAIRR